VLGDLPEERNTAVPNASGGTYAGTDSGPSDATPEDSACNACGDDARDDARDDAESGTSDAEGATDATVPCTPDTLWFADRDGDGYGRSDDVVIGCPRPPSRVLIDGDCNDNNALVHPQQAQNPEYFPVLYRKPDGTYSFDYDCSGAEDGNPSQARLEACGLLSLALCVGSGYAQGPRSGFGIDPVCSSTTLITCEAVLANILVCGQVAQTVVEEPYRCR
jgi:hypothetical protein